MKKLSLLLVFILSAQNFCTISAILYRKKRFPSHRNSNGRRQYEKGFAQDFMLPDVATFSFMGKGPKYANLDRKEVKFKSSKSDTQVQLIPVSDIKSLLYTNEETQAISTGQTSGKRNQQRSGTGIRRKSTDASFDGKRTDKSLWLQKHDVQGRFWK
jgi:hypothetical protein